MYIYYIVKDFVTENWQFLSFQEFNQKFNIQLCFLEYFGCSDRNYCRKMNITLESRFADKCTEAHETISEAPREAQTVHNVLIGEASKGNICKNGGEIAGDRNPVEQSVYNNNNKIKEV